MFVNVRARCRSLALAGAAVLLPMLPATSHALPWDIDMFRQESLRTNEVARSPVPGTVPIGYRPFTLTIEEAETQLQNPVEPSRASAWRGQRLFNANCATCHGKLGDGKGPVGVQLAVPDLRTDFYRGKSDGRIFGVIKHGLRAMPRYGFKFSDVEQWDIVNYLRVLQGREVEGFKVGAE